MAGEVVTVGDAEFRREVLEAEEAVLVDFTARWCAPCRALSPVLEGLARDYQGRLKVVKLDVDDNQLVPSEYGIRAMPTMLLFHRGKVVRQLIGAMPRAKLESALQEFAR